ncbi:MAG: hypothetical protein LAT68_03805 [Cyclobacteriaceae bacterium]|nr:hypothetical protein [Cyclobacteriaceae bacterium]MCH8515434.1 hypothetical protein [Cyclobacteriaceae bacterium]
MKIIRISSYIIVGIVLAAFFGFNIYMDPIVQNFELKQLMQVFDYWTWIKYSLNFGILVILAAIVIDNFYMLKIRERIKNLEEDNIILRSKVYELEDKSTNGDKM